MAAFFPPDQQLSRAVRTSRQTVSAPHRPAAGPWTVLCIPDAQKPKVHSPMVLKPQKKNTVSGLCLLRGSCSASSVSTRPPKSSAAIRDDRDSILSVFPDGAGDRLTFQSAEIRRPDLQRVPPADWLRSPVDFRLCAELRRHWCRSLTCQVNRDHPNRLPRPAKLELNHRERSVIDTDSVSIKISPFCISASFSTDLTSNKKMRESDKNHVGNVKIKALQCFRFKHAAVSFCLITTMVLERNA